MEIPQALADHIDEVIGHYPVSKRSATLPLLHLLQEHFGYISEEAITWVATKLELEPINVLELVTFYPMLRQHPVGKHHIRVCRTLSCALGGGYALPHLFVPHQVTVVGIPDRADRNIEIVFVVIEIRASFADVVVDA